MTGTVSEADIQPTATFFCKQRYLHILSFADGVVKQPSRNLHTKTTIHCQSMLAIPKRYFWKFSPHQIVLTTCSLSDIPWWRVRRIINEDNKRTSGLGLLKKTRRCSAGGTECCRTEAFRETDRFCSIPDRISEGLNSSSPILCSWQQKRYKNNLWKALVSKLNRTSCFECTVKLTGGCFHQEQLYCGPSQNQSFHFETKKL